MSDFHSRLLWALLVLGLTLFAFSWSPDLGGHKRREYRWLLRTLGVALSLASLAMRVALG